jgi:hypothetical protein
LNTYSFHDGATNQLIAISQLVETLINRQGENKTSGEVKQYLLKADYESKEQLAIRGLPGNLGEGGVPQNEGKTDHRLEISLCGPKIVRSLEPGVNFDSEEAYQKAEHQEIEISLQTY